jgi:hypothetical protein
MMWKVEDIYHATGDNASTILKMPHLNRPRQCALTLWSKLDLLLGQGEKEPKFEGLMASTCLSVALL